MKTKSIHWLVLVSAMLCLGGSLILESVQTRKNLVNQFLRDFQIRLTEKENFLQKELQHIARDIEKSSDTTNIESVLPKSAESYSEKGFLFLFYRADSLCFWTDNYNNFAGSYKQGRYSNGLIFLGNAWFTPQVIETGPWKIVGLILLKHEYPYENRFLNNTFQEDFRLPASVIISADKVPDFKNYVVTGFAGTPVFILNYRPEQRMEQWEFSFPVILFLFFISFLFLFVWIRLQNASTIGMRVVILGLYSILYILLRIVMIHFQWPGSLYGLSIFNPSHFAASQILPSLGDFLLNAIGLFFLVFYTTKHFPSPAKRIIPGRIPQWFTGALVLLLLTWLYDLLQQLFASLILDSDISFEARNVIELSIYGFAGLLSVGLLFAAFGMLSDYTLRSSLIPPHNTAFYSQLAVSMIFGFILNRISTLAISPFLLFFPSILFIFLFKMRKRTYTFSVFVTLIIIASLYAFFLVDRINVKKELERGKVLAMSLSTEHDPIAELMLDGMADKIRNDSLIAHQLFRKNFRIDELFSYIQKKYFFGYWGKYDLQATVCDGSDSMFVQPDNKWRHCYTFFDELVRNNGFALADSGFYYLDNRNGRISYFCRLPFTRGKRSVTLHLQLDSKPVSSALGYPELLLDQKLMQNAALHGFSYAKYYKGSLTMENGEFPYSLSGREFEGSGEFFERVGGGYRHLIYQTDEWNKVVLSKPVITTFERAVAFSCIFVFYFFVALVLLLMMNSRVLRGGFSGSFRNRIQYSMIIMLMLSLFLVGGGSIYFSIKQYQEKHKAILSEKMQSVYVELYQLLQHESSLSQGGISGRNEQLEDILRNFSNIFYTDINLYNLRGELLATSRPEIFINQLTGTRMNRQAYEEMSLQRKAEYIHPERIGSLTYLSAYVPFLNSQNKVLAYLNLPYFTRQNMLAGEVSNLVVAFINVYLLLMLLSVSLAVFISRKITQPLRLIQAKIGKVKLGRAYEKIIYPAKDELAGLVEEYNRMLGELEVSAEKLARSERETAWREMARQIAHEIKNPLTPMRLSVQHLQRAWDDKSPRFDELLDKLTQTLIEQIDNLSSIASEFSSFATLPKSKQELLNLVEIANHTLSLFEQSENLSITLNTNELSEAWVRSDREQLGRALINLVKNGMQAIPEGKPGIIRIGLKRKSDHFLLSVEDNGTGIPGELQDKLFQPNFTTKSAGMGLGLAIVKRTIESSGGKIWFETQAGLGTSFYIELPEEF